MEEVDKGSRRGKVHWLQKSATDLLPVPVEKALRSDALQGVVLKHLE